MTDLIGVFSRASARDKAVMLRAIASIGDVPGNLFSMRSDANSEWKKESLWSELDPAGGAKYGYTVAQFKRRPRRRHR